MFGSSKTALPNSFASLVTVFKFSHEAKFFADLKRDLLNFDSDSCRGQPEQGTSSHFIKDVKCFKCGKLGHQQSECRAKVSVIVCYECGAKGHKANECPKTKNKSKTGAPRETTQNKRFYTKRNESNLTAEKQGFSFHTSQIHSRCKNIDFLIDSGCTSHMIKDAELLRDLDISKFGNVECANGTESSIEGRGSVSFLAKDNQGRDQILELEQSSYVPQYTKNLVSIKKLNEQNASVHFDANPRIVQDERCFPLKCFKYKLIVCMSKALPQLQVFNYGMNDLLTITKLMFETWQRL